MANTGTKTTAAQARIARTKKAVASVAAKTPKKVTKKAGATVPAKRAAATARTATKTAKPAVKKVAAKTPAKRAVPAKVVAKKAPARKEPPVKAAKAPAKTAGAKPATKASPTKAAPTKGTAKGKKEAEVEVIPQAVARDGARLPSEYDVRNRYLFRQRNKIKAELATLEEKHKAKAFVGLEYRRLQRLRRDLDDITQKIIDENYGLVRDMVKKFSSNSSRDDTNDFQGAAILGLMRSIDNYDPDKGKFAAWAYKQILREVLRAVHSADFANMNPSDFERRPSVLRARDRLTSLSKVDGYKPTNIEIANEVGCTVEQVSRILDAPRLESLASPIGNGDGDSTLGDLIPNIETDLETRVITNMEVADLNKFGLSSLDEREMFVLVRRNGLDGEPPQKLAGIGEMLDLSREAVRQIQSKALAKMGHPTVLRRMQRSGRS